MKRTALPLFDSIVIDPIQSDPIRFHSIIDRDLAGVPQPQVRDQGQVRPGRLQRGRRGGLRAEHPEQPGGDRATHGGHQEGGLRGQGDFVIHFGVFFFFQVRIFCFLACVFFSAFSFSFCLILFFLPSFPSLPFFCLFFIFGLVVGFFSRLYASKDIAYVRGGGHGGVEKSNLGLVWPRCGRSSYGEQNYRRAVLRQTRALSLTSGVAVRTSWRRNLGGFYA